MADLLPQYTLHHVGNPTRNMPRQSTFCLLHFDICELVQVWTMDWRGRQRISQQTRVTTQSVILPIAAILLANADRQAAAYLCRSLSSLQLPESLLSEIIERVARNFIISGYVRGTGMSINVTIHATRPTTIIHQPIENQNEVTGFDDAMIYDAIETDEADHPFGFGFDDAMIYDAIEMDEADHQFGFGAVPATESSIECLEKVRFEVSVSESEWKQTQCSICLEEFEAKSDVTRLPCLHVYHGDCITQWLEKSHMCPLCRFSLPQKS